MLRLSGMGMTTAFRRCCAILGLPKPSAERRMRARSEPEIRPLAGVMIARYVRQPCRTYFLAFKETKMKANEAICPCGALCECGPLCQCVGCKCAASGKSAA